ncbi:ADP/ATP carrier protein [Irineochytrium annulatum]|nr:ADP/ATP carrier protein [Irineochytrium annulatum]
MPQKLSPFGDALSGAAGAVFANTVVFPLDVVKTRLQVQNKAIAHLNPSQQYNNAFDAILKILKTEGFAGLYAGMGAGLLGTVASSFSYFYFYSSIRTRYTSSLAKGKEISTAMELILGAAAGAMSQLFTLPIAVVTTRQQTTATSERKTFMETMREILKDEGISGLWKGLKASLVLCVNPAITYGVFERVKALFIKRKLARGLEGKVGPGEIFLIGALSKTLATVVTPFDLIIWLSQYPYIMAKVRMQWRPPKNVAGLSEKQINSIKYSGSIDVLKKVFESDGLIGWYKGMQTQITKAVLCQAILFVGKDQFAAYTLMLFALLEKSKEESVETMLALKRLPVQLRRGYATVSTPVQYQRKGDQPLVAPTADKTVTKTSSGVAIATHEGKGPVSTLAFVLSAGSRYESPDAPGVAHFMKNTLVRTVAGDNIVRTIRDLELRGNSLYTSLTREHLIIASSFLRDDLVDIVPLLVRQVFNPSFQPYEFLDAQPIVLSESAVALADPTTEVLEKLHQVAFRTGLGNPLFATEASVKTLKRSNLQEFATANLSASRIAFVGDGVLHEDVSALVEESLQRLSIPSSASSTASASQYFGGEARIEGGAKSTAHYAVAFKSVPFTSPDYAASLVLRAVLDGSQRLKWGSPSGATALLSKAASPRTDVTSFGASYSDAGVVGFYVKGATDDVKSVAQKSIEAFKSVASGVSDSALTRAKKSAIVDIEASSFSTRDALVQEIGRQVLTKGSYSNISDVAAAINKVTADDVAKVAKAALSSKASVVARGNLLKLPYLDDLKF